MAAKSSATAPSQKTKKRPETIESSAVQTEQKPGDETIRRIAYEKWEAAGCPSGDGVDFWLQAEQECKKNGYVTD